MYINGDKPRAPVEGIPVGFSAQLTDAQKLTRYNEWAAVTANSGTYTVKGNTLELHAIVAKNTAVMTSGVGGTFQLRFEGNSVWLTATTIGGVKSANPSTFRLERLE